MRVTAESQRAACARLLALVATGKLPEPVGDPAAFPDAELQTVQTITTPAPEPARSTRSLANRFADQTGAVVWRGANLATLIP